MTDEFEVVGEASTGREAVAIAKSLSPDVVVMDIAIPSPNGFEATRQILSSSPNAISAKRIANRTPNESDRRPRGCRSLKIGYC